MKLINILSLSLSLLFAFGIIGVSLYQEHCQFRQSSTDSTDNFQASFSVKAMEKEASASTESSPSAAVFNGKIDYYLPYPGILPDHPLYWLKMIRDKIKLSLTNQPEARFYLLLLYADKRIGASEVLVKGRKFDLAGTTATKAEKYLWQTAEQYQKLTAAGKASDINKDQIKKAVAKHREILKSLLEQAEGDKSGLEQALQINSEIQQQANNF